MEARQLKPFPGVLHWLLASVILLAFTGSVWASDKSERLYSKGLADFHAERYAEALALFDQAVAADPNDPYALYYRAVTRARLEQRDGAIADLRRVRELRPELKEAALELGVLLTEAGAYTEALPVLEEARTEPALAANASLFLGVAQLRLGNLAAARESFSVARADPALAVAAHYYQGVITYQERNWSEAERHFSTVVDARPDSAVGREAAQFLRILRKPEAPRYQLYAGAGYQYDSNVVLAPSDDDLRVSAGISDEEDSRFTLDAGANVVLWRAERWQLLGGYEFFQSLHLELDDFNIQDHQPGLQLAIDAGRFSLGVVGQYDYFFLKDDSFLSQAIALPWLSLPEGQLGRAEIYYRMRRRDFLKRPFSGVRDAFNHSPGVRQLFFLGAQERFVSVGYRFDREDPVRDTDDANQFAYDGHEVSLGLGWTLPAKVRSDVVYSYRRETYPGNSHSDPNSPPGKGRLDKVHEIIVAFRRPIHDHLNVTAAYFGTVNNSNDEPFEYNRHIGSLAVEVRF